MSAFLTPIDTTLSSSLTSNASVNLKYVNDSSAPQIPTATGSSNTVRSATPVLIALIINGTESSGFKWDAPVVFVATCPASSS